MFELYLSVFILALLYRIGHSGSGLAKTLALYHIWGIFDPHVSTLRLRLGPRMKVTSISPMMSFPACSKVHRSRFSPPSPLILRPQLPTHASLVPPFRILRQRSIHGLAQLPDLPHRHLDTSQQHQRIHLPSAPFLHQTHFPLRIRRDYDFPFTALLLHQRRVHEPFFTRFEEVEGHTDGVVE